ncbi:MAG: T9SS type A sorting domain-containing protein [Bacteroidetes bacterium]|nr:T9SS type A sorting domain-containing protein [Bacteroidota bacterium]MBK7041497.1 T9SS type A sorting domain-containing protein [Bacteroidota bacterium]MBK8330695.1 T9SS type A sorting domain-containing protein [Bacteroidota bacterium]MBK9301860.1 T9SS type A sorting domain-containing protein [Bacteroidota bacterium]MBK9482217.1 T9SS type A sorting domain-containing protein [Bacteroidota bacterium]
MKKLFVICAFFILLSGQYATSQNLSGKRWIQGARAIEATFTDTSRPTIKIIYGNPPPYYYLGGHSNICDSATGKLLFSCNGMVLYDSLGGIMDNGDHLVESFYYNYDAIPSSSATQSSLILPKGNNGLFYVFISTISDSAWDFYVTNAGGGGVPFDRLQVNVVDMNANGGHGSVIVKNKMLLQGVAIHKTMMQACRHSNGIDWWLLKQGEYDTNRIYRFLVKADTIEGPWIQNFAEPKYSIYDRLGQYAFSKDGTKFASVQEKANQLFLADFDRCTGELSNPKVFNIPVDSTTIPNPLPQYLLDSLCYGVCFSPNGQYIYITRRWNIYQFEYQEPDSMLAWYRVIHGPDTTHQKFQYYSHLYGGVDGRIYIGYFGGQAHESSVIDKPDIKGVGCQFCRKCFRLDTNVIFAVTSPPNMPDYTLGPSGQVCWPVGLPIPAKMGVEELEVWPNPSNSKFYFKNKNGKRKELYNLVGELLYTTHLDEIDIQRYTKGIYFIKCDGQTKKVIIE